MILENVTTMKQIQLNKILSKNLQFNLLIKTVKIIITICVNLYRKYDLLNIYHFRKIAYCRHWAGHINRK